MIKKQDRSRCFNDEKLVIFFQPHNNLYYVTCSNLIVSTLMAIMDTAEENNIQLGCMVDVKLHISWKVNLQTAYT